MNRLGVHALCWTGGWTEAEARLAIEGTARLGYDLIEIPALDPSAIDAASTVRLLEEHGLGVTVSLGLGPDTDITSADQSIARRGEAHLKTVVSLARDLGSTHVCGVIYSAMQKYIQPATKAGIEQSASILRRICEQADASGMRVGLEVVNRYETNVMNTAAEGVAFCKMVGMPNAFVHLDTYHMNIEESDVERAIAETGDYLGYFHIGESHRGYLGSGSIDFRKIFRGLQQAGYGGPITFESFSSEVVSPQLTGVLGIWRNLWSDGEDLCRHARDYMLANLKAAAMADNPGQ